MDRRFTYKVAKCTKFFFEIAKKPCRISSLSRPRGVSGCDPAQLSAVWVISTKVVAIARMAGMILVVNMISSFLHPYRMTVPV